MKSINVFWGPVLMALAALSASSAFATSSTPVISSRPILFVHGFNVFGIGEDCKKDWSVMEASLAAQGFTGPMTTLSYYGDDINCDVKMDPKGSILTPVPDTSKVLAWWIYNNYSAKGIAVDVVAHSLGGLLTRYALYRVAVADPTYPPFLSVTHAATIASPYTGYSLVAELCHLIAVNIECDDMDPLSPFIADLKNPAALVPQGLGGTLWSGIGSNADFLDDSDGFVNSASATSMEIPATAKTIMPWYKLIFHTGYTRRADIIQLISNSLSNGVTPKLTQPTAAPKVTARADAQVAQGDLFQAADALAETERPGRILANYVNYEQNGAQFTNVLKGGVFDQMGIQEGDIVVGCSADTLNEPFATLDAIKNTGGKGTFQFCIIRDGAQLTRTIAVQ